MSDCWCKACGRFMLYPESHVCPGEWEVWESGESRECARVVRADTAEGAAETWAEADDRNGDYTIVGGSPVFVCAAKPGDDTVHTFFVEGQSVPRYTVSHVAKEDVEAVESWNAAHPVGTPVLFSNKRYDSESKTFLVTDPVEAVTTGPATLAMYKPEIRVSVTPYVVKLKYVQAIEKGDDHGQ